MTKLTPSIATTTSRFPSLSSCMMMGHHQSANKALSFDDDEYDTHSDMSDEVMSDSALASNVRTITVGATCLTSGGYSPFSSSKSLTASMTSGVNDAAMGFQVHHRQASLQTIIAPNTPYPLTHFHDNHNNQVAPLHASINPFTPPSNSTVNVSRPVSRDVSLVRVAAANYSAIKQKASSMAMLSTEKKRPETPSVENARMPIRKCLVSR